MAALQNHDEIILRLTDGGAVAAQRPYFRKFPRVGANAFVATVAGQWTSFWRAGGCPGTAGAAPSTALTPDRTTQGALSWVNATGGRENFATSLKWGANQVGFMMLYDRLLEVGNLSGTGSSTQTVGGTVATRNAHFGSAGIFAEIETVIGNSATTITASYSNQTPTSGRTTQAVPLGAANAREAQRWIELPLQDGDTDVTAVATAGPAASTGIAGAFSIVVARPLLMLPVNAPGFVQEATFVRGDIPKFDADTCPFLVFLASGTVAPQLHFGLTIVER